MKVERKVDMKFTNNRKVQGAVLLFVMVSMVIWMLFIGQRKTTLTKEQFTREVNQLVIEEQVQQQYGNTLLEDMQGTLLENPAGMPLEGIAFVDTCNQVYIDKMYTLGQKFIDIQKEFIGLEVEGNKEDSIEEYLQYVTYFEIFAAIGKQLQQFSRDIKTADYIEAIACLQGIQELNKQIPIIQ